VVLLGVHCSPCSDIAALGGRGIGLSRNSKSYAPESKGRRYHLAEARIQFEICRRSQSRAGCLVMTPKTSFVSAVKWAYTGNWGERAFSSLFTFILAAMLGPRDFGVVAIALIYIAFLQMFLDQGFVAALIQRKELEQEHLDAVFWMDMVLSLLLVGVSIVLSGWWAARNHAPEIGRLITVLSLCIPIQGLAVVQSATLSRKLDFKALSIRSNTAVVVSGVVGIAMALAGFRVWALVAQQLTRDFTALVLLWRLSPWRPRLEFSAKHLRELAGFASSNFMAQLAIFAEMQASSVLLGMLFGPVAVGLYRLADRLVSSVVAMATTSIQAVSLPEFSRVQNDQAELRKSALICVRLSSIVTLPVLSGMAAVSRPLMATVGPNWIPAADALRILCLVGMSIVFSCFTGPLLQALSRPHHLAALEWTRMILGIAFMVMAGLVVRTSTVDHQLMGIAMARCITMTCLVAPVFLYILMHFGKISLRDLISAVGPSVLASITTVGAVALFHFSGWLAGGKPLILLVAETVAGGVVGLTVLLILDSQLCDLAVSLPHRMFRSLSFGRA
jgi:O-antigen/teichoic acid export membrane protein